MDSLLESVWLRRRRHLDTDCLAINEKKKRKKELLLRVNSHQLERRTHCTYTHTHKPPKTGSQIATFCLHFSLSPPYTAPTHISAAL
jgi:hypothetical protein